MKKIFLVVQSLIVVFMLIKPVGLFAATNKLSLYTDGTGVIPVPVYDDNSTSVDTSDDFYKIYYIEQLAYIDHTSFTIRGYEYRLMNDLDFDLDSSYWCSEDRGGSTWTDGNADGWNDSCTADWNGDGVDGVIKTEFTSGLGWDPIGLGTSYSFTGVFNGNNFTLNHLFIDRTYDYVGLFTYVAYGEVSNLKLTNVNIATTQGYLGGISGNASASLYQNLHVTGSITSKNLVSSGGGDWGWTAGISGMFSGSSGALASMIDCSVDATITNSVVPATGGLIGQSSYAKVENSYTLGTIYGSDYSGGLIGNYARDTQIIDSYSHMTVTGRFGVGGLLGGNQVAGTIIISNAYATGSVSGPNTETGSFIGQLNASSVVTINNTFASGSSSKSKYIGNTTSITLQAASADNYTFNEQSGTADAKTTSVALSNISSTTWQDSVLTSTSWSFGEGYYPRVYRKGSTTELVGTQTAVVADVQSPTYTISYKKNTATITEVKSTDAITIQVDFNETIDDLTVPKITLAVSSGTVTGLTATNMTKVDNDTYSYSWTVPSGSGTLVPEITIAEDVSGNLVTNTGSTRTVLTVDNTAPSISSVSISNNTYYVGDTVTLEITAANSEVNLSSGTITINGVDGVNFTESGVGVYTVDYIVDNQDNHVSSLPISITLRDAAGNESSSVTSYTGTVSFNFDMIGNTLFGAGKIPYPTTNNNGTPSDEADDYYEIQYVEDLYFIRYAPFSRFVFMNELDFDDDNSYYCFGSGIDTTPADGWNDFCTFDWNEDTISGNVKTELTSDSGWLPIGDTNTPFTGSLNGDSYGILNVYIDRTTDNIGLFGYAEEGFEIKNVSILGSSSINGRENVGAILGKAIGTSSAKGQVSNVIIGNGVTVTGTENIGGVLGYLQGNGLDGMIEVNAATFTGKVVAESSSDNTTTQNIGGIVAYTLYVEISNSTMNGDITNNNDLGSSNMGGIVGKAEKSGIYTSSSQIPASNKGYENAACSSSLNRGDETCGANNDTTGGIVGYYINVIIYNSFSSVDINTDGFGGGLGGASHDNSDEVENEIKNSFTTGDVTADQAGDITGGDYDGNTESTIVTNTYIPEEQTVLDTDGDDALYKATTTSNNNYISQSFYNNTINKSYTPIHTGATEVSVNTWNFILDEDGAVTKLPLYNAIASNDTIILNQGTISVILTITTSGGGTITSIPLIREVGIILESVTIYTEVYYNYDLPKYIGYEKYGYYLKDLTQDVSYSGDVDINKVGSYTITYKLTNGTLTTREKLTIVVQDTSPPLIQSEDYVVIYRGAEYVPEFKVLDNTDVIKETNVVTNVDVKTPGIYTTSITAEDQYGNKAIKDVQVEVKIADYKIINVGFGIRNYIFVVYEDEMDFEQLEARYQIASNVEELTLDGWQTIPDSFTPELTGHNTVYLSVSDGVNEIVREAYTLTG